MSQITVFSKPNCVQCYATYRALDGAGLEYTVLDLSTNSAALAYVIDDLGYLQAPVVVIDEHDHWCGFRPDHIDRIARAALSNSQTDKNRERATEKEQHD